MGTVMQDLKYGIRVLRKSPGFAAAVLVPGRTRRYKIRKARCVAGPSVFLGGAGPVPENHAGHLDLERREKRRARAIGRLRRPWLWRFRGRRQAAASCPEHPS